MSHRRWHPQLNFFARHFAPLLDEGFGLPPSFQVSHGDEPFAVPEADPAPGGATPDAGRRSGRSERGTPRGLRRPGVLHPRLQEDVRRAAAARHLEAAQQPRTSRRPG